MKKIFLFIFSLILLGSFVFSQGALVLADPPPTNTPLNTTPSSTSTGTSFKDAPGVTSNTAKDAGFATGANLQYAVISGIINTLLGIVGIIFVSLFIYAGITWLSSRGKEDKITKAKQILIYAIIGLMVVIGGYSISTFIGSAVQLGSYSGGSTNLNGGTNYPGLNDPGTGAPVTPDYTLECTPNQPQNCCNVNPNDKCIAYSDCRGIEAVGTSDCYPLICCRNHLDCGRFRTKDTCSGSNNLYECKWSTAFQRCNTKNR